MRGAWLWLLPLLPALGGGLLLLGGRQANRVAGLAAILLAVLVCVLAVPMWRLRPTASFDWLDAWSLHLSAAAGGAPLATLVAVMALLVLIYAEGFLHRTEARSRFFGFMSLFLGAMLILTLAADLLTLLIGWELVGMCSYALIGFWYHEAARTQAALRAFVVTRAADLGLYLAALAAATGGTLLFARLAELPAPVMHLVAAGLVLAAVGKSAQLPFTGWLSGAMQGPTPVSALLHSATMVAAGVVLLVKAQPLLQAVGWAGPLVVWLGVATALTAGVIALYQAELKQVMAASTASQYGYLFAALGAGGVASATAHLANHAAFKSLLFLCAGVLVAQHLKYFERMGGLRRRLPWISTLFAVATLSLAALPPLGGFFSKEALLHAVDERMPAAYWLLLAGGLLTAAYATRAWLAAFAGRVRSDEALTDVPARAMMFVPMLVLGLAVLLLGALALHPLGAAAWARALGVEPLAAFSWSKALLALVIATAGVIWVFRRFRRDALVPMRPALPGAERWFRLVDLLDGGGRGVLMLAQRLDRWERSLSLHRLLENLLRQRPRLATVGSTANVAPLLAHGLALFDRQIPAGLMERSGRYIRRLAGVSLAADRQALDGVIGYVTQALDTIAARLQGVQSGQVYRYYLFLTFGIVVLFGAALLGIGG